MLYIDYETQKLKSEIIKDGHVWLAGDNPPQSEDSRMSGQYPLALLEGKVIYKAGWLPTFHICPTNEIVKGAKSRSETTERGTINSINTAAQNKQPASRGEDLLLSQSVKAFNITEYEALTAKDVEFILEHLTHSIISEVEQVRIRKLLSSGSKQRKKIP